MSAWRKITCEEREALVDQLGRSYSGFSNDSGVHVLSSLTDLDGEFGRPEVFTEWGYGCDRPILRDHRYPQHPGYEDRPCEHFAAGGSPEGQPK